jgi:phage antirepressor YoqD-like protein
MTLLNIPQSNELTMSSREIAMLLGKSHSNIKISAERLAEKGTIALQGSHFEHRGNTYNEWLLNKRDSLILVAQNCPEFTAAIVDRWQELESKNSINLPDFSNPAEAARAWAEQFELNEIKQRELELAAPKVAFVDNLVERKNLMTATQVAAKHGMSAVKLNNLLDELGGVYNQSVKRGRVFIQSFIDSGYGELKQTEQGYSQALFTPAGEVYINEKLISEGVI